MRWSIALVLLAGCAPTSQERLSELSADGAQLYRQGAYQPATETFRAALVLKPNDPDLLYNLACCQEKMGDPDAADKLYREVLQHDPDHAEARHAIVQRFLEQNRRDEAVRFVSAWLRSSPNLPGPYIEDGLLLAAVRNYDAAAARFGQAVLIDPGNPRASFEWGKVQERQGKADMALIQYERSLVAKPDQPDVRARLAALRKDKVSPPIPE